MLLPPRYFSWRMRGAPLSALAMDPVALSGEYVLIVATSSVDLATLQSIHPTLRNTKSILYFHENQFDYPKANQPQTVVDWQMVSIYSAIRADRVVFNTDYNRTSFLYGAKRLFKKLPDLVPKNVMSDIEKKSSVLPVSILASPITSERSINESNDLVKVLWNHRWEWDKSPELLKAIIRETAVRKLPIQFIITGQQFRTSPKDFDEIKTQYSECIFHIGFVENNNDYVAMMSQCSIVLSTAIHEFQGISVLEAVSQGCVPLLPNRLSYTEIFNGQYLYNCEGEIDEQASSAVSQLQSWLANELPPAPNVSRFLEENLTQDYQKTISV